MVSLLGPDLKVYPAILMPQLRCSLEVAVVATRGCSVKICSLLLINTCQALLADMTGSFGMAAGFVNLPNKTETRTISETTTYT